MAAVRVFSPFVEQSKGCIVKFTTSGDRENHVYVVLHGQHLVAVIPCILLWAQAWILCI